MVYVLLSRPKFLVCLLYLCLESRLVLDWLLLLLSRTKSWVGVRVKTQVLLLFPGRRAKLSWLRSWLQNIDISQRTTTELHTNTCNIPDPLNTLWRHNQSWVDVIFVERSPLAKYSLLTHCFLPNQTLPRVLLFMTPSSTHSILVTTLSLHFVRKQLTSVLSLDTKLSSDNVQCHVFT